MWQTYWSARERAASKQSVAKNPDHNRHASQNSFLCRWVKRGPLTNRHLTIAKNTMFCGKDYIPNPLFEQLSKIEWG